MFQQVGVNGPITKEFVGNLNKIEYLHLVSHLALQHTFLLLMQCEILHTCAQFCAVSYPYFKSKKRAYELLSLSVEDELIQSVLSFVRECKQ